MARVLSVDLALDDYEDFGLCVLESRSGSAAAAEFMLPSEIGLKGQPDPQRCAAALAAYCDSSGVSVLLLDGPQGWKDPTTREADSRVCEALLGTATKMQLPGVAAPPQFLPYARFSVALFAALAERGAVLPDFEPFALPPAGYLLLETYPPAAWKALGLAPQRPKDKAKLDESQQASANLQRRVPVSFRHAVNHDEASALVAGLAGIAVSLGNDAGYKAVGAPLFFVEGTAREGYIVVPTLDCLGEKRAPAGRIRVPPGPARRRR